MESDVKLKFGKKMNKTSKRTGARGRTRRSKKRFNPQVIVNRSPQYTPDLYRTRMRWNQIINVGAKNSILYNLVGNGPIDPTVGASTRQPLGWDELSILYRLYNCHAMKVKFTLVGASSNGGNNIFYTIYPSTSLPGSAITLLDASEQPYARTGSVSAQSGENIGTIVFYMTTKKIYGLKKYKKDNDAFDALTQGTKASLDDNGFPLNKWFLNLQMQCVNGSDNMNGVFIKVDVVYYVDFFGRRINQNAPSTDAYDPVDADVVVPVAPPEEP